MEKDKVHNGVVSVTIDGRDTIEFKSHTYFEVLEALIERRFELKYF